jgi:hypothetical protein
LLCREQYDFRTVKGAPQRLPAMRIRPWVFGISSLVMAAAAAAEGRGLLVDPDRLSWPSSLRGRLQLSTESLSPSVSGFDAATLRPRSAALFGDYYVSRPFFGNSGGMRLTSGVVTGPRGAIFGPGQATAPAMFGFSSASRGAGSALGDANGEATQTLPYLGIGYSGSSLRGGLSFSADLGLTAQNNGSQRLTRAVMSQSLDDTLRELRFTPVLQLGMSYRF